MTKVFNLTLSLIFIFSCICNGNPVLEVKTYPMKGQVVLHLEQFNRKVKSVTEGWSDIKDEAVEISPAKKIALKIEFE